MNLDIHGLRAIAISLEMKRTTAKKREKLVPRYLFNEGSYHESSSSDPSEENTRKRRKFSTIAQKVNYIPCHVPITSSKSANTFYLRDFSKRETPWKIRI